MYKIVIAGVAVMAGLVVGVWFVYFHHPPPDDILAANARSRGSRQMLGNHKSGKGRSLALSKSATNEEKDAYYYSDDYEDDGTVQTFDDTDLSSITDPLEESRVRWDLFMQRNNYISVGELYDGCDPAKSKMVGRVAIMQDKKNGGVKTRTFANFTLEYPVTGGIMGVHTKYNGNDLYHNAWDLCLSEEGMPDRVIYCPLKSGMFQYAKDLPIPSYLPKGTYFTRSWILDQNNKTMGCSFTEFTI